MWIKTQKGDVLFNTDQLDKIYKCYDKENKLYKIFALKKDLHCELGCYYNEEDCNLVLNNILGATGSINPFTMFDANFRTNPCCKKVK